MTSKRVPNTDRAAGPGQFVTKSGRVLMKPVRGSKLSAREIDRAIRKVAAQRAGEGQERSKRK